MSPVNGSRSLAYVLITAAYNEEAYIEQTLRSVISQTYPPKRWVVVSDGSTDRTDEIILSYAESCPFIELFRIQEKHKRNFGAQVNAINAGYDRLRHLDFDFVGNLDADVSFEPDYFSRLLERIEGAPEWGLAGGFIFEKGAEGFQSRRSNSPRSVAHAVQFYRRKCYDSIGGYKLLRYGGPDWCAEISARMKGWRVESIADLPVYHHRQTGGGTGKFPYAYEQGLMAHSLGSHPLFEFFRSGWWFLDSIKTSRHSGPDKSWAWENWVRLAGFAAAYCRREERLVEKDFIVFLRKEQKERLRFSLGHLFTKARLPRQPMSLSDQRSENGR